MRIRPGPNALRDQELLHRTGAARAKRKVVFACALLIGVAFDHDLVVAIVQQPDRLTFQNLTRRRAQRCFRSTANSTRSPTVWLKYAGELKAASPNAAESIPPWLFRSTVLPAPKRSGLAQAVSATSASRLKSFAQIGHRHGASWFFCCSIGSRIAALRRFGNASVTAEAATTPDPTRPHRWSPGAGCAR